MTDLPVPPVPADCDLTGTTRTKVPDRLRFEVFKRDLFACQYCGRKAPDVVLNADHIHPVAAGGTNDLMNLVTSCRDCNSGKSDRLLGDESAVQLSRAQAELIEERRQQVQMMATWHVELAQMTPEIEALDQALGTIAGRSLTDDGRKTMRKLLREFSVQDLIAAMAIAFDQYSERDALAKIGGIAKNIVTRREDPEQAMMQKIVNALGRKLRGPSWKKPEALRALLAARDRGVEWLELSRLVEPCCQTWDEYIEEISK
jgi:hypothetical protein